MSVENGYLDLVDLKTTLGQNGLDPQESDVDYELAIEAASRWIDDRCSDYVNGRIRHFWLEPTPVARIFDCNDRTSVECSDFDSTAGVIVKTDDDGDGVFETTWTSDQWQAEPFVRVNGFPFRKISTTTRTREFPISGRRPNVQVTAQWGWATIPKPVSQACQILAVSYMLGKQLLSDGGAAVTGDTTALVEHLLRPYLCAVEVQAADAKSASAKRMY